MSPFRVFILTTVAMIAFAANSLLCRAALRHGTIDAASFSSIRIISGAIALWLILVMRHSNRRPAGSWRSAAALFAYVAAFSFAYNTLSAGIGALLLFAAVQSTMIIWGFCNGERFHLRQWIGFVVACAGLVLLLLPGISTPPLTGSILMLGAGVAWGIYSLRGKKAGDPIAATAGNFLRAMPMTLLVSALFLTLIRIDTLGATYAVISGAITSGLGYVIWYSALPYLTATSAATVQLSAPVIAALGGILFLHESLTLRFLLASVAVLGGIALVVMKRPERV
ncbi:MAG TPA: DMT family transporter [Chthoniobacterales bacterium]|nr:DMT family transporter [Chthoniobacterales bacterium]